MLLLYAIFITLFILDFYTNFYMHIFMLNYFILNFCILYLSYCNLNLHYCKLDLPLLAGTQTRLLEVERCCWAIPVVTRFWFPLPSIHVLERRSQKPFRHAPLQVFTASSISHSQFLPFWQVCVKLTKTDSLQTTSLGEHSCDIVHQLSRVT